MCRNSHSIKLSLHSKQTELPNQTFSLFSALLLLHGIRDFPDKSNYKKCSWCVAVCLV